MATGLTVKQEKFCKKYLETGNASEAYRQAYDAKGMKADVINVKACQMLKQDKIAVRVKELQSLHQKRHEVTVDSIVGELEEARSLALITEQPSAAVSASLGKARLHGLLTEKMKIERSYEEMTDDELLALARSKGITAGETTDSGRPGKPEK